MHSSVSVTGSFCHCVANRPILMVCEVVCLQTESAKDEYQTNEKEVETLRCCPKLSQLDRCKIGDLDRLLAVAPSHAVECNETQVSLVRIRLAQDAIKIYWGAGCQEKRENMLAKQKLQPLHMLFCRRRPI